MFRNEKDVLVHIDVAGEHIQTTPGHPFYVAGKGWVKAGELKAGNELILYDGRVVEIEKVRVEKCKPVTTYNFEVEDSHTYYVTQTDVLVHNICVAKNGDYRAIVNTAKEHGRAHAHILKNGQRIAKIEKSGKVVQGALDRGGGKRFVTEFWDDIVKGIERYYPKR